MKYGKLTQTVWNRSVRKQLHTDQKDAVFALSAWERCSGLRADADGCAADRTCFVWADAHTAGDSPRIGYHAVLEAAGELAAKGALPSSASVRVLLPPDAEEEVLRRIAGSVDDACSRMGIRITAFQGETTPAAAHAAVVVTAAGILCSGSGAGEAAQEAKNGHRHLQKKESQEEEILLCGYAGLSGTLRILDEAEEELGERFVSAFLEQTKALTKELVTPRQILALSGQVTAARQITGGGILAALWELAESLDTGFEIDMSAIALKQETVEICEFYRLNPYQMISSGSFLIVTEEAQTVMEILEKAGARAVRLGVTKAQNARVITSGEEVRYLDRPAPDELVNWMAHRKVTDRR